MEVAVGIHTCINKHYTHKKYIHICMHIFNMLLWYYSGYKSEYYKLVLGGICS